MPFINDMRVQATINRRELVEALVDATGLPWNEVWDCLHPYFLATLSDWLPDALRHDEMEQERFATFVYDMRDKEVKKRQTAPVGEAV